MENRVITCISCPLGCEIEACLEGEKLILKGNRCPRGEQYATKEIMNPERVVTSSVLIENGVCPLASVKTSAPVPKALINDLIQLLRRIKIRAPVRIGQVVLHDALGLGVDIIATREVLLPQKNAESGCSNE